MKHPKESIISPIAALILCVTASAQSIKPPEPPSGTPGNQLAVVASSPQTNPEDIVVMSPFVVTQERDNGYAANDTLAATRLRTQLRDVAATVSVVTKQLMDDLGTNNLAELLVYTAGTEVTGIGGNYSGNAGESVSNFEEVRNNPIPVNRIRGVAGADTTRNYFSTVIPLDGYNTKSATINRGANATLFGLGSPAGIIENSLVMPEFRNRARVALSFNNYNSARQTLDFERVLIPDKISIRVAAVNDNGKFEQEFTYRDIKRLYAALEIRPFKNTSIRVNGEAGKMDQRMPRPNPPMDGLSTWYLYGKQYRDYSELNVAQNTTTGTYELLNNLNAALGFSGGLYNPGIFYSDASDLSVGGIMTAFPLWVNTTTLDPNGQRFYYMKGVRQTADARQYALANPPTDGKVDPVFNNTFSRNDQLLDRSVFDYRKRSLYGPNDFSKFDFNAINVAIEQLFLNGNAGIELALDRQTSDNHQFANFVGNRGDSIGIDINQYLNTGELNPNFLRPVVSGAGSNSLRENWNRTYRATAFIKHDFRRNFNGNWFARVLGNHTLTAFYADECQQVRRKIGQNANLAPSYTNSMDGNNTFTYRNLVPVVYIGPSLADTTSEAGLNATGVLSKIEWPDVLASYSINRRTNYQWQQVTNQVYTGENGDNWEWLLTGYERTKQEIESYGGVLMSHWLNGVFVSTLGWRYDSVRSSKGSMVNLDPITTMRKLTEPELVPGLSRNNSTFSSGFALHMPMSWVRRMPGQLDFSLYLNKSENFRLSEPRNTIFGKPIDPETGRTNEWGVGLRAFGGKLNMRLTHYVTKQENVTDSRTSVLYSLTADIEKLIINQNTPEQIAATGYSGFDDPNAPQVLKDYFAAYNFRITGTNTNGTRVVGYTAPVNVADVTGAESKGFEFEVTYNPTRNWRITANVFQQEAVRGIAAPNEDALLADRFAAWEPRAVLDLINNVNNGGVSTDTNATIVLRKANYLSAQCSENQPVPELAKWRANLITNYDFRKDTIFKGLSIGGAVRWQEGIVIGYPVKEVGTMNPNLPINPNTNPSTLIYDVENAWKGKPQTAVDVWFGYGGTMMSGKVKWRIQFNIRNLFDKNKLIITAVSPIEVGNTKDYRVNQAVIGAERTWQVTTTFDF